MPATSILLKFKVHSLTDTYHAVGTSVQGSFNKELGRGRDLIVGGGVVTEDDLKLGVGVETQISLDGKYGEFTIRVYAENELGLRSKYAEVVKQVLGPSVDGTYSFGDVNVAGGEVVGREFVGSDTYDIGNTTKVNLDFRGASPNLNWRLLAPPGHALEGNQLDSSMVKEDGFFDKFVISFWRPNGANSYVILDSDDETEMIDDIFGDILEDMGDGKWQSQTFFLNFPESSSTNFSGLAGGGNNRKLLIKIEAHAIKFNANDSDKISHLEVTLENSKTKLKTNFVETVANDFIFSYEVQDIDLSRVEVLQYRKKGEEADDYDLVKTFGGPSDSGTSRVQLGTIKAQQKWSNGRGGGGSSITSLVNIYKYVIAVYDSFGLSSAYAIKSNGEFEEKDSIADAFAVPSKDFESVVKIGDVTIADVADKFNISWSLVDARGNGISFDNDSNSDFASVVSGVVGYFRGTGSKVVDAFKVSDDGKRFTEILDPDEMSELKQEYGVTLIPNISKEENQRLQTNLSGTPTEASRSLNFTLKLLDSRGEVIDELDASGTNEQPAIVLGTGEEMLIHNYTPVGSISIDFKFNENVEYVKIYRKPHKIATVTENENLNEIRYAQRSPRTSSGSPFGLTEKTPWAEKYNSTATPDAYFGSGSSAAEIASVDYLVSTQRLSDPNSTEADPGKSNATVVDADVPITQLNSGGSWGTEILTRYDYVIVPYDTFGAGVPYLIPAVEVIAYHVTTEDDEGFVGFMDVIPPPKPVIVEPIKTSFETFFLEWEAPPGNSKVSHYKVTMIRDSRPLKARDDYGIPDADGELGPSSKWPKSNSDSFIKWAPVNEHSDESGSWAAVSSGNGNAIAKVSVTENTNPSGMGRTRPAVPVNGHLKVVDNSGVLEMWVHKADGTTDHSLSNLITFEEYIVNNTSLAIEGKKNETGYFFIEAIDRVGNHSPPHDVNGTSATLGQSTITDIADFEKEITAKFPSAVVLVPDEPFAIDNTTDTLSWSDHIIYRNGEGVLIKAGSIKLQPNPTADMGWEFLGPDVTLVDYNRIPSPKPTRAELNDRYIKSIYWDPDGGYDTSTGAFKATINNTGRAKDIGGALGDVDENIEYQKEGFYSFSIYNPASATLNLKDEVHHGTDDDLLSAINDIIRWQGAPESGHYGLKDFVDILPNDSQPALEYPIDVTNFVTHFKANPDWGKEVIKYHLKNEDLDDGGTTLLLVDAVRKYYGIHMPLESKGEGLPVSPGSRSPLVRAGSKSVTGSVTIARINRMPNGDFSTTSQWHAFANAVIGTAMIDDASIKTAHVNDLSADVITAGEIGGHEIILGEKRAIGEPVDYGSIRSKGYAGIYDSSQGFVISGDGSFSFSKRGTSLSFDEEGLLLRGTLTQPDGVPVANLRMRATSDQVLISDFQVPGDDATANILAPSGGTVTIHVDIKGAFDFNGNPLSKENVDVLVYPEDLYDEQSRTGANPKVLVRKDTYDSLHTGDPATNEIWWWHPYTEGVEGPTIIAVDENDINKGVRIELGFGPDNDGHFNKFVKRVHGENSGGAGNKAELADYFSVEVRLKYVNEPPLSEGNSSGKSGGIKHSGAETYREGDYVVNSARVYQAITGNTGEAPTHTSGTTGPWKFVGDGESFVIATDIFEINQLREASDALSFQLRPNEGTVLMGGGGDTLDFTPWLIYGSTNSYDLTDPHRGDSLRENPSWVKNSAENILITREVVAEVSDYPAWDQTKNYVKGEVVSHDNKIFTCYLAHSSTATTPNLNGGKWQEETSTAVSAKPGADGKITWEPVKLGNGAGIAGNNVVRDSFGINGDVKFQNILFTMTQYTDNSHTTELGILDTIKFSLLQHGNSAGELSFYQEAGLTNPKYAINRTLADNDRRDAIDTEVFFQCRFFEGPDPVPGTVTGYIHIDGVGAGEAIKKTDIAVYEITDGSNSLLSATKYDLTADDDNDVSRITLKIKKLNPDGDVICAGSEQIDIISVKPENKAFRLSLKRGFIEYDGGSNAVNENLLSATNIVPLQLSLGADNIVNKFNDNDEVTVVPSFGWVVDGEALNDALTGASSTSGRVMPEGDTNDFLNTIAYVKMGDATPVTTDKPYYIYKDNGVYKFKKISGTGLDGSATLVGVTLASTDEFLFYVPHNAKADTSITNKARKHGLSIKATYNRPIAGIGTTDETYEDIEELNVIEVAAGGVSPFWVTSDNQNMILAADFTGKISFATATEGLGEVNVYRGNEEIFLAPKSITLNGDAFDLSNTLGSILKYEKANASALTTAVSSVGLTWEASLKAATQVSFEQVQDGTPDVVRISASGDSFPQGVDNQKRHVVIMDGSRVLQFGDFKIDNTSEPDLDGSYFAQTNFIAWPDPTTTNGVDADITKRPADLDQGADKSFTALEINSGSGLSGFSDYRLVSNFGISNEGRLSTNNGNTLISIAGMTTKVRIYDNQLGVSSEGSFERTVGLSKTGAPGPSFAYRGEYSPFKHYKSDTERIDVVKYTSPDGASSSYYRALLESGPSVNGVGVKAPGVNDWWAGFNELQSTATDLLLASDIFVKKGIVTGIDREVGTQQLPSFIASQLESRYYNLDASFDQLAMARLKSGIDFTDSYYEWTLRTGHSAGAGASSPINRTAYNALSSGPIAGTTDQTDYVNTVKVVSDNYASLNDYLSAKYTGTFQSGWYLDQTDWDYYITKNNLTSGAAGASNTDKFALDHFLDNGNKTHIRIRQDVPDSATDGTRSIRSRRSQKTYKTPNDKLPGFFLGFDKIDTSIAGWSSAGVGAQVEEDFYVPKFELRSVFGNFLYWDGMNLNIKGAIINASTDDHGFRQLMASDSVLALAGPANPDIGGQTFIGGGFNNELTPSLDNLGSSIMGGGANKISKNETAVNPRFSVIGGGYGNEIHNPFSFIGGGYLNRIGGFVSRDEADPAKRSVSGVNSIVGGSKNEIMYSDYCAVGTGFGNTIQDSKYSTILNGYKNAIDGGDVNTKPWLDAFGTSHWNKDGQTGPDFEDDIFGGITGVKCIIEFPDGSADPFEWKPFRHVLDGRAGEEEIRRFYKYAMSTDVLPYSEGVLAKDYSPWANATDYSRNHIVQHQNKAWVCAVEAGGTSTGDTPSENSGIWYDVTGPREYNEDGDGGDWKDKKFGDIPWGAMGDPRFGKNGKWALDIGLEEETHYISGEERMTEFQKFLKFSAEEISNEQSNGDFDWNGKTWVKTVLPAPPNKNSSFASIFNDLKRVQHVSGHAVNNWGNGSHISIFDTGYTSGGKTIYLRAKSKAEASKRQFDICYYDNNNLNWIPITTSTWGWPIVKMEARELKGVYGTFKAGDDYTILWEAIGTPNNQGANAGAKALVDVFSDTSFSTASSGQKAYKDSMAGLSNENEFRLAAIQNANNAAQITPDSIVTLVPEPTGGEVGESWYNTIVGGDYNKIAKSRRSTIVGGRGVSLFQVERAIVGGLGNLLIGTPNRDTGKLPRGFTVFGTENIISHEAPDFIPHATNWKERLNASIGHSYISALDGEPDYFNALANTVFGSYNRIRNSDRMTVLGSNNDVLFECGQYAQTGSEITILGTDNEIKIAEDVGAVNLGIFGTNFKLTQPAMVQNTFYIGNPKIESTDLKALTRVFVAADGGMFVTGDVIAFALSDKKYKENVQLIESPLEKLLKIRGVTFDWNKDQDVYEGHDVGVLADEVEKVLPEVVENRRTGKAVRYEKLTPLLIEAVKAQQEIIDSLTARVKALESKR